MLSNRIIDSKSRSASAGNGTKTSSKLNPAEPEKKEKKKKKKDDSGIKKPLSAFMLYTNHRRSFVREEYPGKCIDRLTNLSVELKLVELSKIIGAEWGKLSETQKSIWTEKAQDLQLQYKIDVFNAKDSKDKIASGAEKPSPSKKEKKAKVGEKRPSPENPTSHVNGAVASKAQKTAETGQRKA